MLSAQRLREVSQDGRRAGEVIVHHAELRKIVFRTCREVLQEEEALWQRARGDDRMGGFAWVRGVRCAPELAIGYLVMRRLLTQRLVKGYCWPERRCAKGGAVDLWIGPNKDSTEGLGVEFKNLMSKKERATVRHQADRLCDTPNSSAAFILWGHGIEDGSDMDPQQVFEAASSRDGWTWQLEDQHHLPGFWGPGEKEMTCRLWMFSAVRQASPG